MDRNLEHESRTEAQKRRWYQDRDAHVANRSADEGAGREIFVRSIKSGAPIRAGTTSDLRVLGAEERKQIGDSGSFGRNPVTVSELVVTGRRPNSSTQRVRIVEPARAAGSGFVDEITLGAADHILAAGDALAHGGLGGWGGRYHDAMQSKRAEDAYDEAHFGLARNAGRVAGLGASIALMGLPAVERAAVRLLPYGAKVAAGLRSSRYGLDRRGLAAMAATGGAGAGVMAQGVSDGLTGHLGSLGDYVASGVGGIVDGLTTLAAGPGAGGAAGGAATTTLRDLFSDRRPTFDSLIDSAHQSAVLGQVTGSLGSYVPSLLSPIRKGRLGELMTDVKTVARGDGVPFNQGKSFGLAAGGHTFTDSQFHPGGDLETIGINEAKLGPTARLRARQLQAKRQLGPNYVVDGWRFSDVGRAAGAALSPYGVYVFGDEGDPWNGR